MAHIPKMNPRTLKTHIFISVFPFLHLASPDLRQEGEWLKLTDLAAGLYLVMSGK
jgi:hypothetical protein